ncbi:MAG: hypothetical protein R2932_08500 [Caldilineaceae bacterium]
MDSKAGRIIRNVATLDLRTATAETLAGIRRIDNVATVIYSAEKAELVANLSIGNVASMVKLPEGARLVTGQEEISRDTFKGLDAPLDIYVTGQVIIKADVPEDELRAGLNSLYVTGQLLYPESLAGAVKAKVREVNGQAMAYSDGAQFIMGKLTLTEGYLRGLAEGSVLLVFGRLDATALLPNELIAQKIEKIEVMGRVTCREENAEVLLARTKNAAQVTTIPTGYAYLAQPLVLDANLLDALPGKKLYGSTVRIEPDVTAEALDTAVEALTLSDLLIAPAALRSVLAKKCNLLETEAVLYEGELWLIENETTLHASRFDYLEGKATLVVRGELTIADDIEPKLLAQQLAKVHNWGEIHCTPAQMSALQARLGTNKGEFVTDEKSGDESEDDNVIGNAAYLVL